MKSYKIFIIVVVGLIVVNCGMLGAFWYQQRKQPSFNGPPVTPNVYLIKELELTTAQQDAYETMRQKHFAAAQNINRQTRELKDQFFDNIKTQSLDTAAALAIQTKINALQLALDTTTLYHFRELRQILTPGQQEKFDRVIKNALHMMGGPHGRPPHGPGPDGMPPPPPPGGFDGPHGSPPDNMPPPPPPHVN